MGREKKVVGFLALIGNIVDITARDRTGAAMPASEVAFYQGLLGGQTIAPEALEARLGVLGGIMDKVKVSAERVSGGGTAQGAPAGPVQGPGMPKEGDVKSASEMTNPELADFIEANPDDEEASAEMERRLKAKR